MEVKDLAFLNISLQPTFHHCLCAASRGKRSFGVPEVLSRALPGELWGAFNVVTGIARSYVSQATRLTPKVLLLRCLQPISALQPYFPTCNSITTNLGS